MKTIEQLQAAVDEIRSVCKKHGIVLVGTCRSESINGEITILPSEDNDEPITNEVEAGYRVDHPRHVESIG